MDLSEAEDEFDIINRGLQDRMAEYIAALGHIPYATGAGKMDLWNAAQSKLEEIKILHDRLGELTGVIEAHAGDEPSPSVVLLIKAGKATGWVTTTEHASGRTLIHEWQEKAKAIRDPVARASALDWLRRALGYAEADRSGKATDCLKNAKPLLNR